MPALLDYIHIHFSDPRQEPDDSVSAVCTVCEAEGHPGKRIKIFIRAGRPTGVTCERFAPAGLRKANREHCEPYYELLRVSAYAQASITSTLFEDERQITLELDRVNKSVQFLTARNCKDVLHSAELKMAKPDERAVFVGAIPDRDADERQAITHELVQMYDRFRKMQSAVTEDDGADQDGKESAATRLIQLAEKEAVLIHNSDGDGFALMMVDGHKETWPLRSKGFKQWLARKFYEHFEKSPGTQAIQDALGVLEGKARYDGQERQIFIRVGENEGRIFLDLADDRWRAVEIDADGWRVVSVPPVEFRRTKGMLPLPEPERGGSLDTLREFQNLEETSDQWKLMRGSLVMKLRPRGPYPVDVLTGEQGCGKTTRARVFRALVDPSKAPVRSEPREGRDLHIAASNEWFPIFDNVSKITPWLSDAFCCLSTGGGMRLRELWTDGEEVIFSTSRPITLTSIIEVVERPDLLDRSIIYNLPVIPKGKRKPEKKFWAEFEKARPGILGALLDAVSCALKNEDTVEMEDPPRMADFARWASAAETAMGMQPGEFLKAYLRNLTKSNDLALEAVPFSDSIIALAQKEKDGWTGTAKELYDTLFEGSDENEKRKRQADGWPKNPRTLSGALRRIAPNLRKKGVETEFDTREGKKRTRKMSLKWVPPKDDDDADQNGGDTSQEYKGNFASSASAASASSQSVDSSQVADSERRTQSDFEADATEEADARRTQEFESCVRQQNTDPEDFVGTADEADEADAKLPLYSCVALDWETEEFNERHGITPRNAKVLGLSISYDGEEQTSYTEDRNAWALLMPELEQNVIMHHAKFDLLKTQQAGLPAPPKWECTMIAAHLLDECGNHGLKPLAKQLLGVIRPDYKEVQKERLFNPNAFDEYAKADARDTYNLWKLFEPELERQGLLPVYALEKALVPVVLAMENRGMLVDVDALKRANIEMRAELTQLEADIYDTAGHKFKINSPRALATVLTDGLGLEIKKKTSAGAPSVDAGSLQELAGQHPVIALLLRFRELDKLARDFIAKMPRLADQDGRVHPTYNQLGAVSGRFSCSDPNVQQLPRSSGDAKVLRAAFIAGPGRKLVVADWSQIELRIIAQLSKDRAMNEAFETGADLHMRTAARMFSKSEAEVTKEERGAAKAINFGIAYGMGAPGLFKSLNAAGVKTDLAKCKEFIAAYNRSYPDVKRYFNHLHDVLSEQGYVTTGYGRRRRMRADGSDEQSVKNSVIQGSGADIAKDAMIRLHAALPAGAYLTAMIHDEFVVECDAAQAEEVRALMVEVMSKQPDGFTVPLKVDSQIGDNWGACK